MESESSIAAVWDTSEILSGGSVVHIMRYLIVRINR